MQLSTPLGDIHRCDWYTYSYIAFTKWYLKCYSTWFAYDCIFETWRSFLLRTGTLLKWVPVYKNNLTVLYKVLVWCNYHDRAFDVIYVNIVYGCDNFCGMFWQYDTKVWIIWRSLASSVYVASSTNIPFVFVWRHTNVDDITAYMCYMFPVWS